MTVEQYRAQRAAGLKRCTACKEWKAIALFSQDASRGDGRTAACRACQSAKGKARYQPVPIDRRRAHGPVRQPRDGDKLQARAHVNRLVSQGHLPAPNDMPCVDCGHIWSPAEPRHEYDHHKGYAAEHHGDVEPVCSKCHGRRTVDRGEMQHTRDAKGMFAHG